MALIEQVREAVRDCRDALGRVPQVDLDPCGKDRVWVHVGGWSGPYKETEATAAAIREAGIKVTYIDYIDLGDEDCLKICGNIFVTL